jgi:hypothetical protein
MVLRMSAAEVHIGSRRARDAVGASPGGTSAMSSNVVRALETDPLARWSSEPLDQQRLAQLLVSHPDLFG